MIEGRDLHNLFSEILGYKLLVRKNTYYVIKMYPIFYIDDMYNLRDYLEKENLSLVKINLETGRNHQIRLQFKSRNLPLYGDNKYNNEKNKNLGLYAYKLVFYHPITKERLEFTNYPTYNPFNKFKNIKD